jgi:hypothetical protein
LAKGSGAKMLPEKVELQMIDDSIEIQFGMDKDMFQKCLAHHQVDKEASFKHMATQLDAMKLNQQQDMIDRVDPD